MATLPEQLERLEASVTRAGGQVHWARDAAEANAIVAIDRARARRARGDQGQVDRDRRDRAQRRRWRRRGSTAIETDLAELINQLARRHVVAHPRAGDPPQPGGDQGAVRAHDRARAGPRLTRPTAIAEAARRHLREKFLSVPVAVLGRELRRRRDRHGRACVESEGNGRMCTTLPRRAGHGDGDREGAARVARPRGLPAAAAALVDRRADEPVHVAVDGRARRRRAAGVPPRAARQRPHATCWPTRSGARRCTASAARPA